MLVDDLMARAKQSLYNEAEITMEICKVAMEEAKELTKSRAIPKPMLMDLAMFRLKLLLKIEPSELDLILAKEALKEAGALRDDGSSVVGDIKFGIRKSFV